MNLLYLLREAGVDASHLNFHEQTRTTGISSDSRTIKAGEIYVALQGLHYDGSCFVGEALERGALLAITQRPMEGERILVVENTRATLADLWDAWYAHPARELSLIGITGTNGKTSTAFMLDWILKKAGCKTGLIGTVECRCCDEVLSSQNSNVLANMTTPDPAELYKLLAQMRDRGAKYVVMEVTSHAMNFEKVHPLRFSRALFTNLTTDHLDLHGDMEEYFYQKRKLFEKCDAAVISFSTPYGERISEGLECSFYEISPRTVWGFDKNDMDGVRFSLRFREPKPLDLELPVPGAFSVENAALAATAALSLGVDRKTVKEALAAFPGVRGRMERIGENPLGIHAFIDYAHTPDALEKLLHTVRGFVKEEQRILLLFGCGGDRDRGKRREMGQIASRLADLLILTSDNCRSERAESILEDILRGVDKEKPYIVIKDRRAAIEYAIENAIAGDVLLLVGKGHEEYEIRGEQRLPFSEREIVTNALKRRAAEMSDES